MKVKDGLDLMDWRPDYSLSPEEDWEQIRRRYFKVYGVWLPSYEEAIEQGLIQEAIDNGTV